MYVMETKVLKTENYPLQSLLFTPAEKVQNPPLIVYLHGAGERGENIEHLYRHGMPKLIKSGKEIPAIVLCPQCPAQFVWNNIVERLKNLIDLIVEEYQISKDRIAITGSSMGGFGTWEMGLTYANYFSAIAPVAGGGL
ncbi:MAG: phospholipase, partial [Clostridia bacterium]|nr:phospholipase [Clostridia bacterium]